jgi:hypothetical protein
LKLDFIAICRKVFLSWFNRLSCLECGQEKPVHSWSVTFAPTTQDSAKAPTGSVAGTTHPVIQIIERANPFSLRVRLEWLHYAEATGGARLAEAGEKKVGTKTDSNDRTNETTTATTGTTNATGTPVAAQACQAHAAQRCSVSILSWLRA